MKIINIRCHRYFKYTFHYIYIYKNKNINFYILNNKILMDLKKIFYEMINKLEIKLIVKK